MTSALLLLSVLTANVLGVSPSDEQAASKDLSKIPVEIRPFTYYVSTSCVEKGYDRNALDTAFKLTCMLTSRTRVVRDCMPIPVTESLYRIDLRGFEWDANTFKQITQGNGYHNPPDFYILRADWLVITLTDARDSNAYYLAVFGKKPATGSEALKILGVNVDPSFRYGYIEGHSQVSKHGVRRIETLPVNLGKAWMTRDILTQNLESDPLEQPEGDFKDDAREFIIQIEKHDPVTRARGSTQFYWLTDGQDKIIDKADVRIVEDATEFRGFREIAPPGGCIQCHAAGLHYPTSDDFKDLSDAGISASDYDYERVKKLQAFYFSDMTRDIRRGNEDYAALVKVACGCAPEVAATMFAVAVKRYDEPLTLARAAWESAVEPVELSRALAWHQSLGGRLPARAAGLTAFRTMPRDAAESGGMLAIEEILAKWRAR